MKSGKKWLAGILSIVMTMSFMPMNAFAGEATSDSADTDAVWTVEDNEGFVLGNYNELQDAMSCGRDYETTIILNRDASGKGATLALSDGDNSYLNFDFNGNTYTITDGATCGDGSERAGICLQGDEGHATFKNGTLKIQNCEVGIYINGDYSSDAKITNFNIDASGCSDCANAVIADQIAINGNSSVKVQPGNNAIKFWSSSTIDTTGTIQGKIVNKDEEDYYFLRIYNGLFTEKPKDEYIANGYTVKTGTDGTFSVIPTEEWAPLVAKIKALQKEVAEAEQAMESDQKEMDDKMKQLETSVGAAEKALNDDIFEEDVDINKAISDAEKSIQKSKVQLKDIQALLEQKGTEYKEKGKDIHSKCEALIEELDASGCDYDNYSIYDLENVAEDMLTVFSSDKYGDEEYNQYLIELEKLNTNLDKAEVKLGKAKELSNNVNKELEDTLNAANKELDAAKDSLNKANKELEELNKKVDTLQNSLKETQDKLKKAEAQLKNQNSTPTPTPVKKPGQVKGLKLKAGKKKVTVTYKKVSGATSYKVTYSTGKKFKKAKTVTVKSGKTVKKTISKLKSKKTYYVKVCAVKRVSGKNYTGKWSAVKKVKVK